MRRDPYGVADLVDRLDDRLTPFFADGVRETAIEGGPDLALNMLADGLYDNEVAITRAELETLESLAAKHGAEPERVTPLRELIA